MAFLYYYIKYLKMTPTVYIRRLKLSKSALRLRDEKVSILDIATDMGFGSVDGYQRAFRREFGINPKEFSQSPVPVWLFTPSFILQEERNVSNLSEIRNVFIQVVEKPRRKVIIKRGVKANEYWSYCKEVGCDVWGLLTSIKSISGEPFAEEQYEAAIGEIWDAEKKYNPEFIGYAWDNSNPRIQLEPRGERGYIELVPVKKAN